MRATQQLPQGCGLRIWLIETTSRQVHLSVSHKSHDLSILFLVPRIDLSGPGSLELWVIEESGKRASTSGPRVEMK
jgi:hypothetical protein